MATHRKLNPEAYRRINAPPHVVQWLSEGVSLPFVKRPNRIFHCNRINTAAKVKFMDSQVQKLLNEHTIRQVDQKPRCILAMQCVPKKGNKLRLVMDCRPINELMKVPKFSQEGITAAMDLVEKDDEMISLDLTDGFHHVPVRRQDQEYLGFTWRNKYFVWQFLPFGVACAPYYFNKVIKPVVNFLRQNNIRLAPFVDDFIVFLKKLYATDHTEFTVQTFTELGWKINEEKSELIPAKERTFVGFIISTIGNIPWIRTMPHKIRKLKRSIVQCLNKITVTARELARVIGQCVAMTKAIVPGKLLLRNCYRVLRQKANWNAEVTLDAPAIKDLRWWHASLKTWNGAAISNKSIDIQIETDASSIGWGGTCKAENLDAAGPWPKAVSYRHSNYRELLAVYNTLLAFKHLIKGKTVQILSDNVTTVAYINKLGGMCPVMSDLTTTIFAYTQSLQTQISARHLAGVSNTRADFLSRIDSRYNWNLRQQVFNNLDRLWGPHTVDRFADLYSAKTRRFNSLRWEPHTEAVDAMAQDWSQDMNYCCPPFWLIPRILRKVVDQKAEATLIAPRWTGQRWYQRLLDLAIAPPVWIANSRINFQSTGHTIPEPLKNHRWRIAAWRISGKRS